ncbi:unnamed protein product [Rotaria sp. Silwood1]|nr:unnamed protein product [Rotaria sp. Silwood1]CAF3655642.1 unnamed protein product [Rotaria sp. Silwood1]CAF4713530.1 unnamed protein product [Rotaria sp. Silwood1]CAF4798465.1 unnamed protein product [Rotaria sp. Silwood1]CAF4853169.1 unnamed protein product [Rotaria sp. Silwood1]
MTRRHILYTIFLFEIILIHVSNQTIYSCSSTSLCGCSANSAILTKIVGGETASSQTWGWAASLRYASSGSHFCGGSIITDSHILTAAHCTVKLSSPASILVYVGSIYLSAKVQVRGVSKIYVHPNYSSVNYVNDISILKLSSTLNLDQTDVDLVCLPNVSSSVLATTEYPPVNTDLVAIGWGYTSEGSGVVSSILQQVTIKSIAANSIYCGNVNIGDSSKQFCAGIVPSGGKDTCQGDSGGPLLMFTSNNVWEQVGITSSGIGCARVALPGIYTRVAAYQSWINDTINNANNLSFTVHIILISITSLIFIY